MYLQAISLGCAVPTDHFDATVHSVFQSSLNLRLNRINRLITLIVSGEGDLPQGIRLDAPKGFTFEKFQSREPAICRNGILRLENNSFAIQLQGARRYQCNLPALMIDITNPVVSASWGTVWEALNKRQRRSKAEIIAEELFPSSESPSGVLLRKAGEAMHDLLQSTQQYDLTDTTAIRALMGLGPGLTPSGDDFLVGYMAGLWSTVRDEDERVRFVASFGKRIVRFSRSTNDISRTYLCQAARGQVSSGLADLAEAIGRGEDPARLLDIAETAMRVGHTSGMDIVTGLLIGLAAWEGSQLVSI